MFRASIRDLFWFTLVAALIFGWWMTYRQMAIKVARLEHAPPLVSLGDESVEKGMGSDMLSAPR